MNVQNREKIKFKLPKNTLIQIKGNKVTIKGPVLKKHIEKSSVKFSIVNNYLIMDTKKDIGSIEIKNLKKIVEKVLYESGNKFRKSLKLVGIGYRVHLFKNYLVLKVGYSHLIYIKIPKTIEVVCIKPTKIYMIGGEREEINLFAKLIKSYKKPEPYKGKGFLYENEKINLKEGKKL